MINYHRVYLSQSRVFEFFRRIWGERVVEWSFVLCFSVLFHVVYSQGGPSPNIASLISAPGMKNASIGICVLEVESGKKIQSYNADMSLVPASSMKVITTSTALTLLGKDYRFKTELSYDGEITQDGILKGNIYIKGYGDPTLGTEKPEGTTTWKALMEEWAGVILSQGIKEINGDIIGDASYFETAALAPTWQWNDIGNYYGAGVFGLNINANSYELEFRQNPTVGQAPKIEKITPQIENLSFINEVVSAGRNTGDNCYIYGSPYQYTAFLRGTIPAGSSTFKVKGSIPEPAFTTASLLAQTLVRQGIKISGTASTILERKRVGLDVGSSKKVFHTHSSMPLLDIVKITNEESINLYCEALLKTIGKKIKGEGSRNKGIEAIKEFWEERGIPSEGFFMEDGCGLSPRNGMSSKHIANILRKAYLDKNIGEDFKNALPIGGETGTLKYLFRNSLAKGRIWAKTGSMDRIRSYSGYAKTKSGKWLSFSIIINNYNGTSSDARQHLETLMESFISL